MEAIIETTAKPARRPPKSLSSDREQWPDEATRSYLAVLHELDRWSHEHGETRIGNTWIAEEAVRQSW